ncbi:hypothetical protein WK91_20035 [Burkholderia cepacia]|nr:hypothetical protein WK91_20035 [Burkholderia cepacia]
MNDQRSVCGFLCSCLTGAFVDLIKTIALDNDWPPLNNVSGPDSTNNGWYINEFDTATRNLHRLDRHGWAVGHASKSNQASGIRFASCFECCPRYHKNPVLFVTVTIVDVLELNRMLVLMTMHDNSDIPIA